MRDRISLKEAVRFHGHLGPYLVLGLRAGEVGLKKLKCKKYFDLDVKVYAADKKPESCLIDGLQLSTGATYGKGNIQKLNGPTIKIEFQNLINNKKIILKLRNSLIQRLKETKTHRNSQLLARQLYKTDNSKLFNLTPSAEGGSAYGGNT